MSTTTEKNYYEILGVKRDAPPEEIRKAYLKLAHKYHPDKTGGDKAAEDMLKEINAAYDSLKNADKRKQYDAELEMRERGFGGFQGSASGAGFDARGQGFDFQGFDFGGAGFEDLFGGIFGRGATGRRPASSVESGADLEVAMAITLEEAFAGTSKTTRLRRPETCGRCSGNGAEPGTKVETCPHCGGSGQLHQAHGAFSVRTTCPHCGGEGNSIASPCTQCKGSGRNVVEKTIKIDIPAGVDSGARLRVSGQGEPGRKGGAAGDLYVQIMVQPHTFFERAGSDLLCEVPVSMTQAALGDKVRVPTINGTVDLNIPEGTQNGAQLRMRGQGMPSLNSKGRGDQLVKINVEVPVKLNKRQRELLRELAEHTADEHLPKRKGFSDWLRRFRP